MVTISSVEAQNNFGKVMNTIPREPVIITKHGKNYAVVIPFDEAITFDLVSLEDISPEARAMYDRAKKLPDSAFIDF